MSSRTINESADLDNAIAAAAAAVASGGVVAYPTETYYALGADPSNIAALEAVSSLKGRDSADKPFLLLIDSLQEVRAWVSKLPAEFAPLAERFWPGPLTLVLPASPDIPRALTGGRGGVALRWTSHPVARRLIRACGGALTGTSANPTGEAPADTAQQALESCGAGIARLVDGGRTPGGPPSTVLDLTGKRASVLRSGAVSTEAIGQIVRLL